MPDYTANPTGADLQSLLTASGLWDGAYADQIDGYVEAAVERWESLTGRRPFLAGDAQTLFFDPPGDTSNSMQYPWKGGEKRLELDTPFTSISAIYTGCTGGTLDAGSPCMIGQNVFLKPDRYQIKGVPIEWIEFTFPVWGASLSIGITGTPGSYTRWPADAFNAVVAGAAARLLTDVKEGILAGPNEIRLGDQSVKQDFDRSLGSGYQNLFDKAVLRFRLIRVGL